MKLPHVRALCKLDININQYVHASQFSLSRHNHKEAKLKTQVNYIIIMDHATQQAELRKTEASETRPSASTCDAGDVQSPTSSALLTEYLRERVSQGDLHVRHHARS